jgi:hypothetical protein
VETAAHQEVISEPPRPLTERERATLDLLLSADLRERDELGEQACSVSVVGRCACGCPTITLCVEGEQKEGHDYLVAETNSKDEGAFSGYQILLFLRSGWLDSIELVY